MIFYESQPLINENELSFSSPANKILDFILLLKADEDELWTLWLSDQIYAVVKDEKLVNDEGKWRRKILT